MARALLWSSLLLVLAAVALWTPPVDASSPPSNATVCIADGWLPITMANMHAVRLHAAEFPATRWDVALLPSQFSARLTVQSYVLHTTGAGRRCDVLLGAVTSTATIAVSPLVEPAVAWMDASATSLELSNVDAHPAFNRAIPTDEIGANAAARAAYQLGWRLSSILCTNHAYGRSVTEAFAREFTRLGGFIDATRCFELDATVEDVEERIRELRAASRTRLWFGAIDSTDDTSPVIAALARQNVTRDVIFLGSEGACFDTVAPVLPSMLCATYVADAARKAAVDASYAARSEADVIPPLEAVGRTAADVRAAWSQWPVFNSFAIDAARHAMAGFYTYHTANQTRYPTMAQWLRGFTTPDGLTGNITLLPNGDRPDARMVLYNVQPPRSGGPFGMVAVAEISGGQMAMLPTNASRAPARFYWFASEFSDAVPLDVVPDPPVAQETDDTALTVLIVVVVLVVVALAIAGVFVASRADPLAHCPLDEAQSFAVMFVAVANESALYDACTPESVKTAMGRVAEEVRAAAKATKCYHAQRVNDGTFMLVAKTPARALECARRIAEQVNCSSDWRKLLKAQPAVTHLEKSDRRSRFDQSVARFEESRRSGGGRSAMRRTKSRQSVARQSSGARVSESSDGDDVVTNTSRVSHARRVPNLRVSVGLATGFGSIDHDPEARTAAYRGDVVNAAAATTDATVPGQVLVTEAVVETLAEESADIAGTFDHYREVDGPAATVGQATGGTLSLHMYSIPGYAISDEVLAHVERQREGGAQAAAAGTGNSIASALTAAATGVALRRAAVAIIELPVLARATASAGCAADAVAQLEMVAEIAAAHRGELHDVIGTRVIVSVNAVGGATVSAAATRAASIASEAIDAVLYAESSCAAKAVTTGAGHKFVPTAGVAGGSLLCGHAAQRGVVGGPVAQQALLAQAAALSLGVPTAFADVAIDDVLSKFSGATVDVAACPDPQRPGATRIVRIIALGAARDSAAADDEWLYAFQTKGGDGADTEALWGRFLAGEVPAAAPDESSTPAAAAQIEPCSHDHHASTTSDDDAADRTLDIGALAAARLKAVGERGDLAAVYAAARTSAFSDAGLWHVRVAAAGTK